MKNVRSKIKPRKTENKLERRIAWISIVKTVKNTLNVHMQKY